MRYFYEKPKVTSNMYGTIEQWHHPAFIRCTVFTIAGKGLAVIQQYYNPNSKHTWWDAVDQTIADDVYLHPGFLKYFNDHAAYRDEEGHFPIVELRKIMWALRMKPLPKQPWETHF